MRVLIILKYIPDPDSEQKSDLLLTIVRGHESEGHRVTLLTSGRAHPCGWDLIKRPGSFRERLAHGFLNTASPSLGRVYQQHLLARDVKREHLEDKFDIILAVCTSPHPARHARAIKARTGIPYVIQEHRTIYERKKRSLQDFARKDLAALREADAVVAVSPPLARIMTGIGVRDDVGVLPNALSDEFFTPPRPEADRTGKSIRTWAEGGFVFGGWTRWRRFKRCDLLLQAFREVRNRTGNARLVIAGPIEPESDRERMRSYVAENDLEDHVWFFGAADRAQIHQLAHAVDCGVVPSDCETFGLPALEVQAAGKPVVTTRCNGPEYVINSEELGRTVEKNNAGELAAAMTEVYEKADRFDKQAIRDNAFRRFSRTSVSPQFTSLYRKVLGKEQ